MKGKRARATREAAFERAKADLPADDLKSGIFRLRGLDAHQDTPVEVLHVILIGIIKYFWRDVVKNQCNTAAKQKELIARLDSFDTAGLGISPLRGHTLVTYAGSLVGRDFRAIAQAAPFVLHGGLVSPESYRAWVELSALVPLVWQPVIDDMDEFIPRVTIAIENLLAATAAWSPRWFNKPKFHLLVHLPDHIRRFGPAILFATEAFESFNAVIRAKSVHSNRQAPSRDIALGFAHGNRVRHLLSGGWFRWYEPIANSSGTSPAELRQHRQAFRIAKPSLQDFTRAGVRVRALIDLYPTVRLYLGIRDTDGPQQPVSLSGNLTVRFSESAMSAKAGLSLFHCEDKVSTYRRIELASGDSVSPGNWVLAEPEYLDRSSSSPPAIARVEEIVLCSPTGDLPSAHLLLHCPTGNPVMNSATYLMPVIPAPQLWHLVPAKHVICGANVQHNCALHGCTVTGRRAVLQERQISSETRSVVLHRDPGDVVLNLGQMRSAIHLQKLAIARPTADLTQCIEKGVEKYHGSTAAAPALHQTAAPPAPPGTPRPSQAPNDPRHHPTAHAPLTPGLNFPRPAGSNGSWSSNQLHHAARAGTMRTDTGAGSNQEYRSPTITPAGYLPPARSAGTLHYDRAAGHSLVPQPLNWAAGHVGSGPEGYNPPISPFSYAQPFVPAQHNVHMRSSNAWTTQGVAQNHPTFRAINGEQSHHTATAVNSASGTYMYATHSSSTHGFADGLPDGGHPD